MAQVIYEPLKFLSGDVKILLILLNQPFTKDNVLKKLWSNSVLRVCCDGAGNQLNKFNLRNDATGHDSLIPDFLCGDLDSVHKNVMDDFKKKGTEIVCLEDQNATDFTKSTLFAIDHCKKNNLGFDVIISYASLGGRLDHSLSNINTLYKFGTTPCYLVSDFDVACLLKPGKSKIVIERLLTGEWCGLIPIGGKAEYVMTTGLKYNLNGQSMFFGGLISTSNSIDESCDEVHIDTSHHLLWTLGYNSDLVL